MVKSLAPIALFLCFTACKCGQLQKPGGGKADAGVHDGGGVVDCDKDKDKYLACGCPGAPPAPNCDCNDADPSVHPGATEACGNLQDDNCNGYVDEGCPCTNGATRSCYAGPSGTAGVGVCKAGTQTCSGGVWPSQCDGQVLPSAEVCDGLDNNCDGQVDEGVKNKCGACGPDPVEICGNGLDDDCNGIIDDPSICVNDCHGNITPPGNCNCDQRLHQPCYSGPPQTLGKGICHGGFADCTQQSNGSWQWGACVGEQLPAAKDDCGPSGTGNGVDENCDGVVDDGCKTPCTPTSPTEICNGLDDNCNGTVDEGCTPPGPGATQPCFTGPPGICDPATQTCKGICKMGTMSSPGGEQWGACTGSVLPTAEICCNGLDDNCDGQVDEGCCCAPAGCTDPNDCGICDGKDNNCNGLVDEGLIDACGHCPGSPCYTQPYPDPWGQCTTGQANCTGVSQDPGGGITLGQVTVQTPFIYISVTGKAQVAKLDTGTGAKLWQVPSYGTDPSRTAVALDYSVWVGNRGFNAANDYHASSLVHLDANDGHIICRGDDVVGNSSQTAAGDRGVAIDADGNIWASHWSAQKVWKYSGTAVDAPDAEGIPRCHLLAMIDTSPCGGNPYGLAVSGDNKVWVSQNPAAYIDVNDNSLHCFSNPDGNYGIAVDLGGNPWFGAWMNQSGGNALVHWLDKSSGFATTHDYPNTGNVTAVTFDAFDGSVWGSGYGQMDVVRIDPSTGGVWRLAAPNCPGGACSNPHGVAVDGTGRIWSPFRYGGYVNVYHFDPGANAIVFDTQYPVDPGQELYTYSDMTGQQLRTVTTRAGDWVEIFDSNYVTAQWVSATWTQNVTANTSVNLYFSSGDTAADAQNDALGNRCGPFPGVQGQTTGTADLTGCANLNGHRYLAIDVRLQSTLNGYRPTVSSVQIAWTRP